MKNFLIILATVFVLIFIPNYIFTFSAINRSRQGCERLNITRESIYINLSSDIKLLKPQIDHYKQNLKFVKNLSLGPAPVIDFKHQHQQDLKIFAADKKSLQKLRESANQYHANGKPKVIIDCEIAYPYPWPFN